MNVFRPLHLRSHYPKQKNAKDTSLTAKQLSRSGTNVNDPGRPPGWVLRTQDPVARPESGQFYRTNKSAQLLMYYYQPLVCGTAQTFLLMSLYCSALPTEYFIALKLSATFMAELTSYFVYHVNDYKLFVL